MAKLITVYWRDIPAQVIAKRGRDSAKVPLPQRFHDAIDRAAMRAGKGSSEAYMEDWRRDSRACGDDLQTEAQAAADSLVAVWPDELLETTTKAKGLKPQE